MSTSQNRCAIGPEDDDLWNDDELPEYSQPAGDDPVEFFWGALALENRHALPDNYPSAIRSLAAHYRAEGMREAAGICSAFAEGFGTTVSPVSGMCCDELADAILAAIGEGK